jgi:hypothetical protein
MVKIKRKNRDGYVYNDRGYDDTRWGKYNEAFEHRCVVQDYIGSELPQDSVVHHIDKVRDHNRIENLLLLQSQQIHILLHIYMKQAKSELVGAVTAWSREWMDELRMQNLGLASVLSTDDRPEPVKLSYIVIKDQIVEISNSSLLRQYLDLNLAYPDHMAVIQVGCFYTAYQDEALLLKQKLNYKIFDDKFTKLTATGTSISNEKFLDQLRMERIPFIRVIQSNLPRRGRVLDRHVVEIFNIEEAAS